jgi:hypothetical protein
MTGIDMGGPAWLADIFAGVMLTVSCYCASRLAVASRLRRPTDVDADGLHVFMGVAMAGMLTASLRTLPAVAWETVFAAGAVWFAWRAVRARRDATVSPWRCPQPVPHLVECCAMVYMLIAVPAVVHRVAGSAGMGAMTGTASRFSFVALAMALFLLGYVVWVGERLAPRKGALVAPSGSALAGPVLAGSVPAGLMASAIPGAGGGPTGNGTQAANGEHVCQPYLAPRCAALCKIAMGITMVYMLVLMF